MRALTCTSWGTADTLELRDIELRSLDETEVRIDVHAAGLNFPDTLLIAGKYQFRPELPFVPGSEAAGIVLETGARVSRFKPGDHVIWTGICGAFSEQIVKPESELLLMPDLMTFEVAASFVATYGTSYYALKQCAKLQEGESLLVLGAAGGVGLAAVNLGRAMGARVIAAASSQAKLDVAREAGADEGINYQSGNLREALKTSTGGRGVDVVYDPVGGPLSEMALRSTGWNGRFLVVGFASGEIPSIPLNIPLLKSNSIIGVFFGAWLKRYPAAYAENVAELFGMHAAGRIHPLVSRIFALDDYESAFSELTGRKAVGKIVFAMKH